MVTFTGRVIRDLLVVLLVLFGLLHLSISAIMFHPPPPSYGWDAPNLINIGSSHQPLAARWMPQTNATHTVLYFHGNAEDLEDVRSTLHLIHSTGVSVFAIDYPGYGCSSGKPTEKSCYATADRAYTYLTTTLQQPASAIIVYGRSIGSGPACYLAEKYPLAGLVLDSGFMSIFRVATRSGILPFDPFPNIARMPHITCPKFFFHGKQDQTIPFYHASELERCARPPKTHYWVEKGDHNDLLDCVGEEHYTTLLRQFFDTLKH
jgi:fermentation-respiration switch protein FrsA (DUF1100 family)